MEARLCRSRGLAVAAMAVEFPEVNGHPNRLPFEGCLTLVDVASDRAPSGARGHRVVLTKEAAEKALPSLLGMAGDYKAGWDGHDARQNHVGGSRGTTADRERVSVCTRLSRVGETHVWREGERWRRDGHEL